MEKNVSSPAYLGFMYGHAPVRGTPPLRQEERGYIRQFLVNQGVVEDTNMFLPHLTYAKDFAYYAAINACSDKQLKKWDCRACRHVPSATFVSSFDSYIHGGHGYLAVDRARKRIITAFRGSANTQNRIASLLLYRKPLPYANDPNVTVSTGFLETMESLDFITPLKALLANRKYADYKIAFVGHSLGGALASLALTKAQHTLDLGWKQLELYTYGQPRTGNSYFARWYNRKPIASARVVNNTDPFPLLTSTTLTDYRHHMNELWIHGPPASHKLTICSNDMLEDPGCSYATSPLNYTEADHLVYFGADLRDQC